MRSEGREANMQPLSLTAEEGTCDAQLPEIISQRKKTPFRVPGGRMGGLRAAGSGFWADGCGNDPENWPNRLPFRLSNDVQQAGSRAKTQNHDVRRSEHHASDGQTRTRTTSSSFITVHEEIA